MFSSYESDKDGGLKEFTKRLLRESDINITDYSIKSQEDKQVEGGCFKDVSDYFQ